jgi:hypothetical protein
MIRPLITRIHAKYTHARHASSSPHASMQRVQNADEKLPSFAAVHVRAQIRQRYQRCQRRNPWRFAMAVAANVFCQFYECEMHA